jgi:glycosyltransferase involved in cell wall biosynthesis
MTCICCQLGAREQYAIPRALFRQGALDHLATDAWVPPSSFLAKVCGRGSNIRDRFHSELRDAPVTAFNSSLILFEAFARARRLSGWTKMMARNRWFQRKVVCFLSGYQPSAIHSPPILFSYSYTALEPFRHAKSRGWKTVLVQIDPGPVEENIVAEEVTRAPELAAAWEPAPQEYWASWREECRLADRIVVNSEWSRKALIQEGVPTEGLSVIPLAYEVTGPDRAATRPQGREYPNRFTPERPLRVLFLGQINLRKGVARLLEAARILCNEPVEFWMVGPLQITNSNAIRDTGRVQWFGPATRNEAANYYINADVFILPTLSDGFAITQLEAQAHSLPLIVSRHCGNVVQDNVNGLLLNGPSPQAIESAIRFCLENPNELARFSRHATVHEEYSVSRLGERLCSLREDEGRR